MSEYPHCYDVEIIFGGGDHAYLIYISINDDNIEKCVCYKRNYFEIPYEDPENLGRDKTELVKIKKHNVFEIIKCISGFIWWLPYPETICIMTHDESMSIPDYHLHDDCSTTIFFENGKSCKIHDIPLTYSLKNVLYIMDFISAPVIFHKFVFGLDENGYPNVTYHTKIYTDSTYFDIFFGGFVFGIDDDFEYKILSTNKRKLLEYIETHQIKQYNMFDINDTKVDTYCDAMCYENEYLVDAHNYIKIMLSKIRNDNHDNETCDIVIIDIPALMIIEYEMLKKHKKIDKIIH